MESGADDVMTDEKNITIHCKPEQMGDIKEKISALSIEPLSVSLTWVSSNKIKINDKENGKKIFNLINELEDNEDVQNISSNYDISEEVFDTIDL